MISCVCKEFGCDAAGEWPTREELADCHSRALAAAIKVPHHVACSGCGVPLVRFSRWKQAICPKCTAKNRNAKRNAIRKDHRKQARMFREIMRLLKVSDPEKFLHDLRARSRRPGT